MDNKVTDQTKLVELLMKSGNKVTFKANKVYAGDREYIFDKDGDLIEVNHKL